MSLYELEKNTPENNQTIVDNLVIAYSKINSPLYDKIICTVSGGYDSDIVVDISTKCDINHKVTYIFFNTGIEYEATKEHIKYLEKKYGIEIIEKNRKNQSQLLVQNMECHLYPKRYRNISDDCRNMGLNGKIGHSMNCLRNIQTAKPH